MVVRDGNRNNNGDLSLMKRKRIVSVIELKMSSNEIALKGRAVNTCKRLSCNI